LQPHPTTVGNLFTYDDSTAFVTPPAFLDEKPVFGHMQLTKGGVTKATSSTMATMDAMEGRELSEGTLSSCLRVTRGGFCKFGAIDVKHVCCGLD
jgi:hypothetical protein